MQSRSRSYASPKKDRLAITTLRTPDARSAQSNNVIVGSRFNAPTLRCRRMATTRLQPFGKGKKTRHPSRSKDFVVKWQYDEVKIINKVYLQ